MKSITRRTWAMVLAVSMPCVIGTQTFAEGSPTSKDEVVYINLNHDGSVDEIYVVNAFELAQPGKITDYGDYSAVRNLTTTAPLSLQNGQVTVDVPAGKFYYQGTLKTREMPWKVGISYTLDGKSVSGEDLAGKSGHLEMQVSLTQNHSANPLYLENFALQATILLDSERCKNIVAPDATVANVGENKQLSYIVLANKEKSFSISTDVTDFEMSGIQINGIPLTLNIDDPDTAELMDKVYELQDGAVELDDGAAKLDDGVPELQDGVTELKDGAIDLEDGAYDLFDGTKDLKKGVEKLSDGSDALTDGAEAFRVGLRTLTSQSDTLTAGSEQVAQGLKQIEAGSEQYLAQLDQLIAMFSKQRDQLRKAQVQPMMDSGNPPESLTLSMEDQGMLLAMIDDQIKLLEQLRAGYAAIDAGIGQLAGSYPALNAGIHQYTEGADTLSGAYYDLYDGIRELRGGMSELSTGAQDLKQGAKELYDGTVDLRDGSDQLYDGTLELKDGTIELTDGTTELRDKTWDMDTEVDDRIDEMMEEYRNKEFVMPSFVSPKNTEVDAVQFVMKVAEIEVEETPVPPEEEAEQPGFLQKLKNLIPFGKKEN